MIIYHIVTINIHIKKILILLIYINIHKITWSYIIILYNIVIFYPIWSCYIPWSNQTLPRVPRSRPRARASRARWRHRPTNAAGLRGTKPRPSGPVAHSMGDGCGVLRVAGGNMGRSWMNIICNYNNCGSLWLIAVKYGWVWFILNILDILRHLLNLNHI
jgi:hypothetical protein